MPQVQGQEIDTKQLVLSNAAFGPKEVRNLVNTIAVDFSQYRLLRDAVGELEVRQDPSPATNVRLGVCLYLLGRYRRSAEILAKGDGGALAQFYMAKCNFSLEHYDEAVRYYDLAKQAGYDGDEVRPGPGRSPALCGQAARGPGRCWISFPEPSSRRPTTSTSAAPPWPPSAATRREVVALFERAVEADRNHAGALFGLALENDRRGNDEAALELYKRSAGRFPRTSARC